MLPPPLNSSIALVGRISSKDIEIVLHNCIYYYIISPIDQKSNAYKIASKRLLAVTRRNVDKVDDVLNLSQRAQVKV